MVKNMKGGSRHKKVARKNIQAEGQRFKARLADVEEQCEVYAKVTKMYGQGNCEVVCNDNVVRNCVIRKKFKGRNKRGNTVQEGSLILVGLRDWEVVNPDKKEKCDLLEVYERYQYNEVKNDPRCNWDIVKADENDDKQADKNSGFEFVYKEEEEDSDELNIDDI